MFPPSAAHDIYTLARLPHILSDSFIDSIKNAFWINTKIDKGFSFVTSDYPIYISKEKNSDRLLSMSLALSPSVLQHIYFVSDIDYKSHEKLIGEIIINHNLAQIMSGPNFIYAHEKLGNQGLIKYIRAMEIYLPRITLTDPI
ncbi:hypothetical protein [Leptospira wolffii]|nr:hypothetical protein [Leptospira wolffii]